MAMKAKVSKEDHSKLSPEFQKEYVEKEGAFVLDVTATDGLQLANVDKLQNALQIERTAREDSDKKMKVFEGLDPAAARDAMERMKKIEAGDLPEKERQKLSALQKQLEEKYEGLQKQLVEKHGTELTQLQKELKTTSEQLDEVMVTSQIKSAILTHKGSEKLLLPVIRSSVRTVTKDGKRHVEIVGKNGLPSFSKKSGSGTDLMDIEEYVADLKNDKELALAFSGSGASGSGASGGSSGGGSGGNGFTISEADARDPMKYRHAKAEAEKAGQQLQIG